MDKVENNRKIIETYYESIASGDFETVISLMHKDVVFNIVGETPYAGLWEGRDNIYGILVPAVVSNFKEGSVKFAERWNVMCVDENRATGLMSAIAETHKGEKLDMTYCHILKFNENQIIEVHEFFDTAQGERLFSNDKLNGHSGKLGPMNY